MTKNLFIKGVGILYLALAVFCISSCKQKRDSNFKQLQEEVQAQAAQNKEDSETLDIKTTQAEFKAVVPNPELMKTFQVLVNEDGSIDVFDNGVYISHIPPGGSIDSLHKLLH